MMPEVRVVRKGVGYAVVTSGKREKATYGSPVNAWRNAVVKATELSGKLEAPVLVTGIGGAFVISPGVYPQKSEPRQVAVEGGAGNV